MTPSFTHKNIKIITLFLSLIFVTRFITLIHPVFNGDETNYLAHALIMKNGGIPYVDFVEKKPPLIYIFYTLSTILFGPSLLHVHALTFLIVFGSAWGLKRLFETLSLPKEGVVAGVLYIIFLASFRESEVLATNCEILMNLPIVWALVYLFRSLTKKQNGTDIFWCGFLSSLAFLFKHQGGIILAISLFSLFRFRQHHKKTFIYLSLGFILPLLVCVVYYIQIGHITELYEWMIQFNFVYVGASLPWPSVLQKAWFNTLGFIVANFFLVYFIIQTFLNTPPKNNTHENQILKWVSTLGLILSFFTVSMGWRFYGHYYLQLYPFLVMLASLGVTEFIVCWSDKTQQQKILFSTCGLLSFVIFQIIAIWGINNNGFEGAQKFHNPLTQEILKLTSAGDKIFAWGNYAYAYALSNRVPASRFVICEYVVPFWDVNFKTKPVFLKEDTKPIEAKQFQHLMSDLKQNQPQLILDTSQSPHFKKFNPFKIELFLDLKNFIDEHYALTSTVEGVDFYVLKNKH